MAWGAFACAVCDLPCKLPSHCYASCPAMHTIIKLLHWAPSQASNIVSTITSLVDAVFADMLTAVRLVSVCLGDYGFAGCICQVRVTPHTSPVHSLLTPGVFAGGAHAATDVAQVLNEQGRALRERRPHHSNPYAAGAHHDRHRREHSQRHDRGANGVLDAIANPVCDVIDTVNSLAETVARIANPGSWFGRRLQNCFGANIPELCFKTASFPNGVPGSKYCQDFTEEEALAVAQCSDTSNGLEHLCFYNRVAEICGSNSLLGEWNDLFAKGYEDFDELEAEFAEALADSYNSLDPALTLLLQKVEARQKGSTSSCARASAARTRCQCDDVSLSSPVLAKPAPDCCCPCRASQARPSDRQLLLVMVRLSSTPMPATLH